jgi:hypothetical protein
MTYELEQAPADQELTELMAGYEPTRSDELPEDEYSEVITVTNEEPEQTHEITVSDLSAELKALKEKVAASHEDAGTVRKLHGEIGNINRTLLEMKNPPPAPVEDTDAAELDALIEEYPDLVGPLVKTLRATQAQLANLQHRPTDDIDQRVSQTIASIRQEDAAETLAMEHPDYRSLPGTPEYEGWLSNKTPEFQERFRNTWNPAVVSRGLTEFKESLKKRESKQERLSSAITPKGVSRKVGESTLSDEEAVWAGYNSGHKRQIK